MNHRYYLDQTALWRVVAGGVIAFLLCCVAAVAGGNPTAVEIRTSIEVRGYTYDSRTKRPTATNAYSFSARCIISPHSWFLEDDAPANAVYNHYFDGTNIYETFRPKQRDDSAEDKRPSDERVPRFARKWKPGMPASVTVIPGAHPMHDMSINVPWMAYCSSAYLRQPGRLLPIPGPFNIRHSLYAFGYADKTATFDDELGLPRSIELYTSSSLIKASPHRTSLLRDPSMIAVRGSFPARVPYRNHELHCQYSVLESTNCRGWSIPLRFTLTISPHTVDNRLVGAEASGRAVTVREVDTVPQFKPDHGKSFVTDLRFRSENKLLDGVVYSITNENLPPTNATRVASAFKTRLRRASEDPIREIRHKIIAMYVMIAGALLIGGAALVGRKRTNTQNDNTQSR